MRCCVLSLAVSLLLAPTLVAQPGRAAAVVRSPFDTINLLGKERGSATPLALNAQVPAESRLMTPPGLRGRVDVKEGDLQVTLVGDVPGLWTSQVLETVVTVHTAKDSDLDLTLARGLALVEFRAEKGSGKVRLRIDDKKLDVELLGKGATIAVELSSRWPEGMPFLKKPGPDHRPVGELLFFVLKGKVELNLENEKNLLQAPVLYRWTTRMGVEGPLALTKEPPWAKAGAVSKEAQALQDAAEKVRFSLEKKKLADLAADKNEAVREVVVYRRAALDDLPAVIAALNKDPAAAVRQASSRALRHYIGRNQAADQELFGALVASEWKTGPAQILMHLLHGFGAEERARPATYDALIGYLGSDQMAIRELAHMTLVRLAPDGRDIAFDAAASAEERTRAQAAWRKLIPSGQVPK